MKHNIYEFCLFLKILYFLLKGSFNIPEYRCLLIGHVQYLYTIDRAVEDIAYRIASIYLYSVIFLSLMPTYSLCVKRTGSICSLDPPPVRLNSFVVQYSISNFFKTTTI